MHITLRFLTIILRWMLYRWVKGLTENSLLSHAIIKMYV